MCKVHLLYLLFTSVCLCGTDLGEALLVDMVHHHYFIVVAGWRAPGAKKRQTWENRTVMYHSLRESKEAEVCKEKQRVAETMKNRTLEGRNNL